MGYTSNQSQKLMNHESNLTHLNKLNPLINKSKSNLLKSKLRSFQKVTVSKNISQAPKLQSFQSVTIILWRESIMIIVKTKNPLQNSNSKSLITKVVFFILKSLKVVLLEKKKLEEICSRTLILMVVRKSNIGNIDFTLLAKSLN